MGLLKKILDYRTDRIALKKIWEMSARSSLPIFEKSVYYAIRLTKAIDRGDEEGYSKNMAEFEYYEIMNNIGNDYGYLINPDEHNNSEPLNLEEFFTENNYRFVEEFSNLPLPCRRELGQKYCGDFYRKKINGLFIVHPKDIPGFHNGIKDESYDSPAIIFVKD